MRSRPKNFRFVLCAIVGLSFVASNAVAEEEFSDLVKRASELKAAGKYPQAMTELQWANKQLEKLHNEKMKEFFPKSTADLTLGKVEANAMMGLANVEASYTTASKGRVKASLMGSSSGGGGAQQGLGALAGLAQMAAMMKTDGGVETVRIKGQRATIEKEGNRLKVTLPLQSGQILTAEQSSGAVTQDQLVGLLEAFDLAGMETYLQAK